MTIPQTLEEVATTEVPRVNLLPPELAAAERFRRVQAAMGGLVVLALVVVGGIYLHERSTVSHAKSQLASTQADNANLQRSLRSLAGIRTAYNAVATERALVTEAMASEVKWSYFMNDIALRIPSNVWLTSIQATQGASAPTSTTASATAPAAGSIGTLNFSGVAFRHNDVASWLDALTKVDGFANPTFSKSTEAAIGNHGVVDFTSSVDVTPSALAHKTTPAAGG